MDFMEQITELRAQKKTLADKAEALAGEGKFEELDAITDQMEGINKSIQALERNLLQYAEKLGLTPTGRVRLAQKRAQAAAPEPDGDLFGD